MPIPDTTKKMQIVVSDNRLPVWFRRVISMSLMCMIPIIVGIILESKAMQWLGFVFSMLWLFSYIFTFQKATTFETIDAAIAYLQSKKADNDV